MAKNFQSELTHSNRRRGAPVDAQEWGAMWSPREQAWIAVIPAAAGDWHRRPVGGPYETAQEASKVARSAIESQVELQVAHLNGLGELCYCGKR